MTPDEHDIFGGLRRRTTEYERALRDANSVERALIRGGRRNRILISVGLVSVILDILLTGGLFFLNHRTNQATEHASVLARTVSENSQNLHDACAEDNKQRDANRVLWEPVIAQSEHAPPPPGETPAEAARRRALLATFKRNLAIVSEQKPCPSATKMTP